MKSESTRIKILLIDEKDISREGLTQIITTHPEFHLVDTVHSIEHLRAAIEKNNPDIVLTTLQTEKASGISAAKEVTKNYPHIPVLAICVLQYFPHIMQVIQAGAKGCVLEGAPKKEIIGAIKTVSTFEEYLSPDIMGKIAQALSKKEYARLGIKDVPMLSDEDIVFLRLLCEEFTTKEIAAQMNTTTRIVEHRKDNLYQMLNKTNVAGLIKYAILTGIYNPFEWSRA